MTCNDQGCYRRGDYSHPSRATWIVVVMVGGSWWASSVQLVARNTKRRLCFFHAPGVPTVSEQGRLSKKDAGECLSARWSMKRCQWVSQCCPARVTIVALPFSTACTVITGCSHSSARPRACQKSGSRKVSSTGIMKEDPLTFRVHTEYSLLAPP